MPVCLGQKAVFSDSTMANGSMLLSYRWDFGENMVSDTSQVRNPRYLYSQPGLYEPQLIVQAAGGCADTAVRSLAVNGLPQAEFAWSLACSHQQTFFFDASQPFGAPLQTWGWKVDDSLGMIGAMQGQSPAYLFPAAGNYQVMLTVADTNRCADTLSSRVQVVPSPVSAFTVTPDVDNIQGQVLFTNGSIGGDQYYWDFGNGMISYRKDDTITFDQDGQYQVVLVTVNQLGCHDTARMVYDMMYKGLWVPNAMATGGSAQLARIWKPAGVNIARYKAEIYDSHGLLIWSSTLLDESGAPAEAWDGTYKEKPCQQDVYVWKISAVFRDGTIWQNRDIGEHKGLSEPVWGTVTVLR
jgi:PKD repeat protein